VDSALQDFKRVKNKEMADWASAMLRAVEQIDVVPKGFFTEGQLAEEFDMSATGIRRYLRILKEKDLVHEKKFRVQCGSRLYTTTFFKLKSNP